MTREELRLQEKIYEESRKKYNADNTNRLTKLIQEYSEMRKSKFSLDGLKKHLENEYNSVGK